MRPFPFLAARLVGLGRPGLWKSLAVVPSLSRAIAGAVTMALTPGDDARFWLYIFPPFRILDFIAGCLLALLVKSGWRSPIPLPVEALSAGVVYALLTAGNREAHPLGNGAEDAVILPFMLLVIASAATANISGKGKFLSHP
jgi:peptidoglycan/LPS O-acetylase OafA/YrhL